MRTELRRGHVAWLAAALIVLITIVVFCFATLVTFSEAAESRMRGQQLLSHVGGLASALIDVRIAQRDYDKNPDQAKITLVRDKVAHAYVRLPAMKEFAGTGSTELAYITEAITVIRSAIYSDNPEDVMKPEYVDKVLLLLREMRLLEEKSFKEKTEASDEGIIISIVAVCCGVILALFLIVYTTFRLNRELLQRKMIEEELLRRQRIHAGIIATQHALATSELELNKVMDVFVERVLLLTEADGAAIENLEDNKLVYRAASGMAIPDKGYVLPFDGTLSYLASVSGEIAWSNDCLNDPRVARVLVSEFDTRSLISLPLFVDGSVKGFLKISSTKTNAFSQRHMEALQILGGLMSSSMERAVMFAAKQKAEKEALESARLKSEFLAHMSHEIRTPANGVVGMLSLLSDTPLNQSQKEYVDIIHRSMDAQLTIMNDILDFSKIEAGKLELENAEFDLEQTISDIEKSMSVAARVKGLEFHVHRPQPFLCGFQGDPGRLRQVLLNLLSNAIKFTHHGHVALRWQVINDNEEFSQIRFSVEDTGIGVSKELMPRVFDSFAQGDASTSRRYGGTGLGLCIAKRLVEMMGGTIECRSELGQGAEFSVVVQFKKGHRKAAAGSDYKFPAVPVKVVTDKRILVAEDNFVNQKVAVGILERLGCKVVTVGNGKEAVEILKTVPFDLVLMDCQMPELDGYEATAMIRANKNSASSTLPIIAMTASAIQGDRERCLTAGMNDYLAKPVRPNDLAAMLEKWLS